MEKKAVGLADCPLVGAMSALGSKWKPIIVLVIKTRTLRFGQIAAFIHIISRKVLTDQLREMVRDGILSRQEFKELPPRVEYRLTEKGLALLPILNLLEEWETKYQTSGQNRLMADSRGPIPKAFSARGRRGEFESKSGIPRF